MAERARASQVEAHVCPEAAAQIRPRGTLSSGKPRPGRERLCPGRRAPHLAGWACGGALSQRKQGRPFPALHVPFHFPSVASSQDNGAGAGQPQWLGFLPCVTSEGGHPRTPWLSKNACC